ncbi:MAG: PRC-barrel domain containing protein [Halanaeroarchaeum sp.]
MQNDMTLTEDDEGKHVKNANGDDVGLVVAVEHGEAHVDPDPGLTDSIRSRLGWGDPEEEGTYTLDSSQVDSITDDEIRLNR